MLCDFIFLMCHEVIRNLFNHGVFGFALFALFIVHHLLNTGFYKATFKGKYNANRILFSGTTWLLFVFMILMAVSSILMSGAVFYFMPIPLMQYSRTFHTFSCSWAFVIMGFHLGLHLHSKMNRLEKRKIFIFVWILLFALGVFCLVKSDFYVYLFCLSSWKLPAANLFLCICYNLGILTMMIVLSHWIKKIVER